MCDEFRRAAFGEVVRKWLCCRPPRATGPIPSSMENQVSTIPERLLTVRESYLILLVVMCSFSPCRYVLSGGKPHRTKLLHLGSQTFRAVFRGQFPGEDLLKVRLHTDREFCGIGSEIQSFHLQYKLSIFLIYRDSEELIASGIVRGVVHSQ